MSNGICEVCGSHATHSLYENAPDYITGHEFKVFRCESCGAAYTSPQPDDMADYYPAIYRRYTPIVLGILKALYRLRVARWNRSFKTQGLAFEMGCGDGLMLDSLRSLGWRVVGNERTPGMARFARDTFGLDVFAGDIEAFQPEPHFDLIILFQVLEHLGDPRAVLAQLSRLLKPNGKMIIGVPNFGSWQARFGKTGWFHLDVPRHLVHYDPTSLNHTLNSAGLEIEDIHWVSFEHDPYGWLQSILNRVDTRHNRLTRLLMQIDRPDFVNIIQLIVSPILGIACVLLSIISWLFRRGAMIEVVVRHRPDSGTAIGS